jgi:hypothetical protein
LQWCANGHSELQIQRQDFSSWTQPCELRVALLGLPGFDRTRRNRHASRLWLTIAFQKLIHAVGG